MNDRNELRAKFKRIQKKVEEAKDVEKNDEEKKKRFRRTADLIERNYECPAQTCYKYYGS